MKTHHVCYEGTLACSGCNPCIHCLEVVNREVLAYAMRRTTEVIAQARGSQGVVAVAELDTQNFWAVFYGHYGEGWKRLHTAMMNDPKVAERAYDLRGIPGFAETGRYVPPALAFAPLQPAAPLPSRWGGAVPSAPLSSLAVPSSTPSAMETSLPYEAKKPSPMGVGGDFKLPVPENMHGFADQFSGEDALHAPAVSTFTLREETEPVEVVGPVYASVDGRAERIESGDSIHLSIDESGTAKLARGPSDIRREITADDIAACATVLEEPSSAAPLNGAAAYDGS